jgi:SPP1 family predicted phage head-tail adaptor
VRAGDLKHQIIIQVAQKSKNSMGEFVDTWSTWATVWAAIEPASGKNYYAAKQLNAEVDGVCRIRYRTGVLPTMRILYGSRVLRIVSIVNPKETNEELQLFYKELLD